MSEMNHNNNEHYDPSILSNLIQDLQESEDKSQNTLKCILHNYGVTISETFTVQDFINSCSDIPWVNKKSLEIFNLFDVDVTENQDNIESSEWATEKMKIMLQEQYDGMGDDNKPYTDDFEKLQSWKELDYREESGVKIINVPWFGEICGTQKANMRYIDMDDKNGKRSLENLKDSDKFKTFASTIQGCELMNLSDTYKLMNLVGKQLGITDTIDENYINTEGEKCTVDNLLPEHPFGRIMRALYVMLGTWFMVPISVNDKTVFSVDCLDNVAWFCGNSQDSSPIRPFAKIRGSL